MKYLRLLVVFILLSFWIGCRPSGSHVKFVIPDNYQGPLTVEKFDQGSETVREGKFLVYFFPSNGALRVRSIKPLFLINTPGIAFYETGKPIDWALPEFIEKSNRFEIKIHQLGATSDGKFHFYIGAYYDAQTYWSNLDKRIPIPPPQTTEN